MKMKVGIGSTMKDNKIDLGRFITGDLLFHEKERIFGLVINIVYDWRCGVISVLCGNQIRTFDARGLKGWWKKV
jgi:hypothetical protein